VKKSKRPSRRHSQKRRAAKPNKTPAKSSRTTAPSTLEGILKVHREGYGFVLSEKPGIPDAFIPPRGMKGAMNGDRVIALVHANPRDGRLEGSIKEILSRGRQVLVARLWQERNRTIATTQERGPSMDFIIPADKLGGAVPGQSVGIRILKYPEAEQRGEAEVIQIFPDRGTEKTELDIVILKHQLPLEFPKEAREEARKFQEGPAVSLDEARVDLRHLPFVTIDGETARDFDDAVYVRPERGGYRLWVSIADVSHYVRPGSALDREAYLRGTSVYFPDYCIPMLPEELSNDLCSLRPREERLAFTCEQFIDVEGHPAEAKFYKSLFRSQARLTYKQVARALVDGNEEIKKQIQPSLEMLGHALGMSRLLRKVRMDRGTIDFDLPEPEIVLNMEEGGIENIVKAERNEAHFMIEEFMISANEAVARFIAQSKVPGIYRIHDQPDPEKVENFHILLNNLGYNIAFPKNPPPKFFSHVLHLVRGHPEEQLIQHILLRSMKQAVYSVENLGHYGLASTCYTHFTSPIRRYPDLVVHRILEKILAGRSHEPKTVKQIETSEVAEIAVHCSRRERVAMEAEWEAVALKTALFMQRFVGKTFAGMVSRLTKFGFFVELKDFFVEGLVRLEDLEEDFYIFDEKKHRLRGRRSGKIYKIGTEVTVTVAKVDIEERQVLFSLSSATNVTP